MCCLHSQNVDVVVQHTVTTLIRRLRCSLEARIQQTLEHGRAKRSQAPLVLQQERECAGRSWMAGAGSSCTLDTPVGKGLARRLQIFRTQ
eukprot:scaffold11269_cov60-Phaeocystis_antarctica.AAC.2